MATIRKRKDGYQITVTHGRDINGKQIRYFRTFKPEERMTERQIEKALTKFAVEFENEVINGIALDNKQTFSSYANYVIALKERSGIKHTTINRYKEFLKVIEQSIGHLKLADIRPQHLNNFYAYLAQDGMNKRTGGKLSNKTITEYHRFISTVLTQAEKELLVPYNMAKKATPPKVEKHEPNYFQIEDIEKIRDALETEPIKYKALTHLLLVTGCRRGEIMALTWSKIDLETNTIKIDSNLLYTNSKGVYLDSTKTSTSNRTITIPEQTTALLKEYRLHNKQLKLLNGDRWHNSDFVFVQDNGEVMNPQTITAWLAKFSVRHNLKHINPHAFRHTMASVLYYNGIDCITISKRLGHAKVSTTTDIYSHIMAKADEEASNCISDILFKKTSN